MPDRPPALFDLRTLLAAVEDAPPFSAADVLGERLATTLGAREVSFLIADFSGHALVRVGHSGGAVTRRQAGETGERVALTSSPNGRALAAHSHVVEDAADGTRVLTPV